MIDQYKENENNQEEIENCLKLLQSKNPRDRSYAAKHLGELKERPDILISMLDDPNGFVRSAAAEALGRSVELPAPDVVSHLLAAIDDPNNYVCAAAVNSLGLLGAKQAIEQVELCLTDTQPIIVQAAILAMARIEPQRIKERLIEFLQSDEYLIHLAATRVCGWLSHKPCGPIILQSLRDYLAEGDLQDLKLPKLYIDVIANLNLHEAIPDLVEIAEKQVGLRGVAVQALVEMNAEEAASILSPLLSDPSNRLRRNLIEMMIQADYKAALPLIRPLLKDNAITVRETALAAVSKWQDRVSATDVRDMAFNDPNPFVRPQAVITLVKLLGQEALPDLVDLADDLNTQVRRAVAQSFAEIETLSLEGKAALIRLAKDEEVADFTKAALISHDLSSIQSSLLEGTQVYTPVPDGIKNEAQSLLNYLERWQALLPNMRRYFDLEELSKIDQALSTLIVALRKAKKKTG